MFYYCSCLLHPPYKEPLQGRRDLTQIKHVIAVPSAVVMIKGSTGLKFGQRDTSFLMTSESIQNPTQQLEEGSSFQREQAELRSGRHADAIFTNSYRKVLGQISARKFLQTIMGKRLGENSESYVKRQSDIYEGTFKEDLTSIQRKQRYRGAHGHVQR
ncbi:somatoliberin [Genypterus blacodes]|uniref:somatoliberin n=1 Tax=Genypterus blacodes TaxID=154954 RepID=UPI003F773074